MTAPEPEDRDMALPIDAAYGRLSPEFVGLFDGDGTLRTAGAHWQILEPGATLAALFEAADDAELRDVLGRARTSEPSTLTATLRGGAVRYQWSFHRVADDTVCVLATPVDPPPAIAHAATAAAAAGIVLLDAEGRIVYANDAYAAIYGVARASLPGRLFTELLRAGDRAEAYRHHRQVIAGETTDNRREYAIATAQGDQRIVQVATQCVALPQGVFRLATLSDVTEARQSAQAIAEAEARYRHIFDHTHEGIYRSTIDGRLLEVNWPLVRMHDCSSKEALITAVEDLATEWYVDPEARAHFRRRLDRDGSIKDFEAKARRLGTGEHFWTSESATVIRDQTGAILYYQGTVRDISEARRQRQLAAQRGAILERVARGHDLVDILYEVVGTIEEYKPQVTASICQLVNGLLQVRAAPGLADACIEAIDGRPPEAVGGPIGRATERDEPVIDADIETGNADRHALANVLVAKGYSNVMALPVRDQAGATLGVLAVFVERAADIDDDLRRTLREIAQMVSIAFEQHNLAARLIEQAQHDTLTGLPNRVLLDDRLNHLLVDAERHNYPAAVMMLDLDEFKRVNDTLGHRTGDQLLRQVAQRLAGRLRASDTIARFGGDEFVIVLPLDQPSRASDLAERILGELQAPIECGGHKLYARPSIGISLFPEDGRTAEALIQTADAAMYAAKSAGKNRFKFFSAAMNREVTERFRLEADLRQAVVRDELSLYYQPIVATADHSVVGAEVLLRWQHPTQGLLLPEAFLPTAALSDLASEIDHHVIATAARQLAAWRQDAACTLDPTSLNLSVRALHQENLADQFSAILAQTGVPTDCLELELSEADLLSDFDESLKHLRDFRARVPGCRLAIDNFGTAGTSFSHLRQLPFDTLKIACGPIGDLHEAASDPTAEAVVRALVEFGERLGVTVVAKGVETAEQAACLRRIGCPRAQGYFYSPPLSATDFEAYLSG